MKRVFPVKRLFVPLAALSIFLFAIHAADAAAPTQWNSVGVGGGGALFSASISPFNSNEIFIACDMSGLFHSTDQGASWSTVDYRQIQSFHYTNVQFTSSASTLYGIDYSANKARPSKSTDGGATWSILSAWPSATRAFFLFADPNNTTNLIVSSNTTLYFSNNGGASFTSVYTDATGKGLSLGGAFFDGANIYVGTNAGLLVSANSGGTFTLAAVGGIAAGEAIFSFAGAKQGATTRFFAVTVAAASLDVSSATDALLAEDMYLHAGSVYSIDYGQANWTAKTTGITAGDRPMLVGMARNDITTAYLAGQIAPTGGALSGAAPVVYKTTTAGASWAKVFNTTNNANIVTGWLGQGGDLGGTWWPENMPEAVAVGPGDPNMVLFTDKAGLTHLTTNGGTSWRQIYTGASGQHPAGSATPPRQYYTGSGMEPTLALSVSWMDANNMWAGFADINAIRSKNGGTTWSYDWAGLNFGSNYMADTFIVLKNPSSGTLYAAQSNGHGSIYAVICLTDTCIDGTGGALKYSTDGGNTWSTMQDFSSFGNGLGGGNMVVSITLDPSNSNRMYALVAHSTGGGIFVSSNIQNGAAATWTKLTNPPRTEGHPYNIHVLNDGTLVVGYSGRINGAGAFTASSGVFSSANSGASWTDLSNSVMQWYTKDVIIDPSDVTQNTWYVATASTFGMGASNVQGGLYKTTNRGNAWTLVFSGDSVESAAVNPNNGNELYAATATSGLQYSANAGQATPTFTSLTTYPFRNPKRVYFNPYNSNEVWVASNGNGLRVGTSPTVTPTVREWGLFILAALLAGYGMLRPDFRRA